MKGLSRQTVPFELIEVDNSADTKGRVAEAMNAAAGRATGKYIMFIHQDVELISPEWLKNTETVLDSMDNFGVAGVAGARLSGGKDFDSHLVGHIKSAEQDWGKEPEGPVKVQTVDELLFIVPQKIFEKKPLDAKTFDFIHLFAADYCIDCAREGLGSYVIPGYVYHASTGNFIGIDRYRVRFFWKHRREMPVFTTCGKISYQTIWRPIILTLLPPSMGIWLRNVRNRLIGRKTDARGASIIR